MITVEEAKKMLGVEFTYIFEDGDTIPAYVKAFDPEIGLSCMSLGLETAFRAVFSPDNGEDDSICLIGINFTKHSIEDALEMLDEIATGKYIVKDVLCISGFESGHFCAFA